MSKVKFIQLTATNSTDYQTKIDKALVDHPGAIIFVANNGEGKQEIWANGKKYEVGGGGGNVIYGTDMINAEGKTYKWKTGANGTLVLDKETNQPIPEETNITGSEGSIYVYTGENTQTAYYWATTDTGGKWKPFNVDAENVWFPKGVLRTEPWGVCNTRNERPEDECIGSNLKQLLENYLVKETWPRTSLEYGDTNTPYWSVDADRVTLTVNNGEDTFSTGDYLLYGGTLKVSGTYNPKLTITSATGFTENADGTKSKAFTLGPSKIVGLANGHLFVENEELVGEFFKDGETAEGETLYYKVVLDKTFTQGQTYPTFEITQKTGGNTTTKSSKTGTTHNTILSSLEFNCNFVNLNDIKSILGTNVIKATGKNSSTWRCSFYEGIQGENGDITYESNAVANNSIFIPGLQVAVASNKYLVDTDHTKSHPGKDVSLTKSKSDSKDEKTCNVIVYLPVYEYNSGTLNQLEDKKYIGSLLTVKTGNLPLAMPDNFDNWWIEVPQCATLQSFQITTTADTYELIGTKDIEEVNIEDSKTINSLSVPYKKIKFTRSAAYATSATLNIKIS